LRIIPVSAAIHGIDCDMTRADSTPTTRSAPSTGAHSINAIASRKSFR
jgi:hypothetical protein